MKMESSKMMKMMTISHLTKRTLRTMGIIILNMDQPEIVRMIIKVMMMVLTHTLGLHQMTMKNPKYPMKQQKGKTQKKTQ